MVAGKVVLKPRMGMPAEPQGRRVGHGQAVDTRVGSGMGQTPGGGATSTRGLSMSSRGLAISSRGLPSSSSTSEHLGQVLVNCPQTMTTTTGGLILLEHPEDLGRAKAGGIPGSI